MKKFLFILGTRPEVIKLAPLIKEMKDRNMEFKVCISGQHKEMIQDLLEFFSIPQDYVLPIPHKNRSLYSLTGYIMIELEYVFEDYKPDGVIVQGDTTTALCGALAGYYHKSAVIHIEAGLRSHKKYSPFPEEINRTLIGKIADYHFVPTETGKINLNKEGVQNNIYIVGNTVIDAIFLTLDTIKQKNMESIFIERFSFIDFSKKLIILTGHRRENFGEPFRNKFRAVADIARRFEKEIEIVYPVHLNPNVKNLAHQMLEGITNLHLIEPLNYPEFVWLMNRSFFIITDSGGIQEEAPSLNKPVLVTRDTTERKEVVQIGAAKLVGTDYNKIVEYASRLITDKEFYNSMINLKNPYGDGKSSVRILDIIQKELV